MPLIYLNAYAVNTTAFFTHLTLQYITIPRHYIICPSSLGAGLWNIAFKFKFRSYY